MEKTLGMIDWLVADRNERTRFEKQRYDETGDKPIDVSIAWRSKRENTYHICENCPYYGQIKEYNLLIARKDEFDRNRTLKLCRRCWRRRRNNR